MPERETRTALMGFLTRLIDVAGVLREAMLARDPQRIQEIVDQQDRLRDEIPALPNLPEGAAKEDAELQAMARQLYRMQESNRLLASSFLRLYRETLHQVTAGGGQDPGGYNPAGYQVSSGSPPILISQTG